MAVHGAGWLLRSWCGVLLRRRVAYVAFANLRFRERPGAIDPGPDEKRDQPGHDPGAGQQQRQRRPRDIDAYPSRHWSYPGPCIVAIAGWIYAYVSGSTPALLSSRARLVAGRVACFSLARIHGLP